MNSFWDYFQIVILIAFTGLVWGRTLYERIHGINAIRFLKSHGRKRGFSIAVITIINVWVVLLVLNLTHPEIRFLPAPLAYHLINTLPFRITGLILIALGFILYISAWKTLGNNWRMGHDGQVSSILIKEGAYSISRNPLYLFYMVYFFGTFLINGEAVFLLLTAFLCISIHYLILEEEKGLAITHGDEYENYRLHTGRYFTFRRSSRSERFSD
jgi:protein-S-isoprenylcysteine O-methyltransferase Ste14